MITTNSTCTLTLFYSRWVNKTTRPAVMVEREFGDWENIFLGLAELFCGFKGNTRMIIWIQPIFLSFVCMYVFVVSMVSANTWTIIDKLLTFANGTINCLVVQYHEIIWLKFLDHCYKETARQTITRYLGLNYFIIYIYIISDRSQEDVVLNRQIHTTPPSCHSIRYLQDSAQQFSKCLSFAIVAFTQYCLLLLFPSTKHLVNYWVIYCSIKMTIFAQHQSITILLQKGNTRLAG